MSMIGVHLYDGVLAKKMIDLCKDDHLNAVNYVSQEELFDAISTDLATTYIISSGFAYSKRIVNTIRLKNPHTVVVCISDNPNTDDSFVDSADINVVFERSLIRKYGYIENIIRFIRSQECLRDDIRICDGDDKSIIMFGDGMSYDPVKRLIMWNGNTFKRLSMKEGEVMGVLSANYGSIVKRDVMLNKIWGSTSIFSSRSFDVHVSKLRSLFKENGAPVKIKSISGVGMIME